MFLIKSVSLTNFRSFVGTHKWELPTTPGLYFLTGRNDANPKLDRNGSGKTSLLDAISWCLYGRTTNGLRGSDVIYRNGSGGCCVSVFLVVGIDQLEITATQNPNSLTVNGKTVDREALVKMLRLNYESFCYSVILPQGGDTFFDLSPANKLTLFSQIMGLDYWLEQSEKAFNKAKEIDSEIINSQRQLASLEGKIDALSFTIDDLMIKEREWEAKKKEKIIDMESRLVGLIASAKIIENEFKEPEPFDTSELDDVSQSIIEISKELAVIDSKISGIKKAQKTVGGKCPVCLQPVNKDHLGRLEKHYFDLHKEKHGLEVDLEMLNDEKSKLDASRRSYLAAQEKARHAEYDMAALEHEILQLQERIREVEDSKNEFGDVVKVKRSEYDKFQEAFVLKKQQISKLQEQYTSVHYWVAGFKRLRLYIVEETLRALEIEVNNNLAALGLADWKIEFDIEREKKDGSVSKGFSVNIISPTDISIRFETFSGGESQLFRLAGVLGLSNLICERAGLVNQQEVLDEPSSHLSKEAVLSLCELLHQRAIQTERVIMLIDHTAIEYGDFAAIITIVKDENGSRIQ